MTEIKKGKTMAIASSVKSSSIVEVLDRILDRGIVIDIFARVSLVGIEPITIEARIVIASIEKYLVYVNTMNQTISKELPAVNKGVTV
jgi:gas vesicle structural protein